ncbi:MAG: branched-chain amino acid ABC transporter permease, partial [Aeromicrobium sp.]
MTWLDVLTGAIEQALGPTAMIYCIAAIGLNIHFGYTGLLNFGQAAFMMVGGYAVGGLVQTWGQNLWLSILVGLLASLVLALILGVPTLRLRADYLAIATIAAAEAIRQILGSATLNDQFGGQDGRYGFADQMKELNPIAPGGVSFNIGGFEIGWRSYDFFVMLVGWGLALFLCLLIFLLMRSPWGRVLKSNREDEPAFDTPVVGREAMTENLGKNGDFGIELLEDLLSAEEAVKKFTGEITPATAGATTIRDDGPVALAPDAVLPGLEQTAP